MEINWQTPHPSVTAQVRAGIEANKATQNAMDWYMILPADKSVMDWEREMASLPDDGVTYVVEGESRV